MKRFSSTVIGIILGVSLCTVSIYAYEGENFFLIAWDGVRFNELDSYTAPHLLGEIKNEGVWLPYLYNAWHTWTSPGHSNIHTGTVNLHPNTGRFWKLSHYYPSLMETYLKEHDLSGDDTTQAWVHGNTPNDSDWGQSHYAGYDDEFAASRKFAFGKSDGYLLTNVILPTLETYSPAIFYVDFHEVDFLGHRILTPEDSLAYRDAIRRVDSLTAILFHYIDTSSVYSGKTNVLITADHGRHTSGIQSGLRDHGCDCDGCRHVFGCLWGPDFKDNLMDYSNYYQTDIAYVAAHVMGLRAPNARSRTLVDNWLANYEPEDPWAYNPSGGINISNAGVPCSSPDVDRAANGQVHTIWCENQRTIIYRTKDVDLLQPMVLATADDDELLREPRISCFGTVVTAIWQRYMTNDQGFHSWYLETAYSTDSGSSWSSSSSNAFKDAAVVTGDVSMGKDGSTVYSLISGVYTAFEGSRDSLGIVSIRQSAYPKLKTWKEQGRYPDNSTYQANFINLERFDSMIVAVCQAYDRVGQNSEIIATWSTDHGVTWKNNWVSVTRDGSSDPYVHQYYPSGLVIFK